MVPLIQFAKRIGEEVPAQFLDDLAAPLAVYDPAASEARQHDFLAHLHRTINAPSSKIRNRLLRLPADSPALLAVIKELGKVGSLASTASRSATSKRSRNSLSTSKAAPPRLRP